MTSGERVTYRSVLRNREFAAILFSQALSIVGDQISRIALALLVFRETHSAFAASATFAVSYLTYLVSGPVLSTLADRYTRRTVMVVSDLARAALVTLIAFTDFPVLALFALIVALSALAPAFDSARGATLPDLLPGEAYPRGSALANLLFQSAQVGGFVAGGALLATSSVRQALLVDAATFLVSAGTLLGVLLARRPQERPEATNLVRDTAEGLRVVTSDPTLRRLLAFALIGAVAVSAPESMAIPVAHSLGGGTVAAGLLTASIPAGFVIGSFAVLRFPPARRTQLLPVLVLLSVVPLLVAPFTESLTVTVALWTLSGCGSSLQLVASAAFIAATPTNVRGRAYGLAGTSLMAAQGVAQLSAGAASGLLGGSSGPSMSIGLLAVVALALLPAVSGLPRGARWRPQAPGELVR